MSTNALILAAGVGARLGRADDAPPKALLRFGGKSLLARHVEILAAAGVTKIVIGVGYRADLIEAEVASLETPVGIQFVTNPDYREGSMVTLWRLREALRAGDEILLMDADVLYHPEMITRLMTSRHPSCLLYDGDFEPGEEPVKICIRDDRIVEFRKKVEVAYDSCGESVGFFRLSPATARALADRAEHYLAAGRRAEMYEEAIRDLLLDGPGDPFGIEDVTGLPWIEIDFPEDVDRAENEILPRIG